MDGVAEEDSVRLANSGAKIVGIAAHEGYRATCQPSLSDMDGCGGRLDPHHLRCASARGEGVQHELGYRASARRELDDAYARVRLVRGAD